MRLHVSGKQLGDDRQDMLERIKPAIDPLADYLIVVWGLQLVLIEDANQPIGEDRNFLFADGRDELSTVFALPI